MKPNYTTIPFITIVVAALGSILTGKGMSWYQTLALPQWTPSGSFIGIVWTILFILAATSVLLVYNREPRAKRLSLIMLLFLINAALNVFWSFLFFNQHFIGSAIIDATLLGFSVVALIMLIWPSSRLASLLLVPYALWVGFAVVLNFAIWRLN